MNKDVIDLLCELVTCPSVSPNDAGCQQIISKRLIPLGFQIENLQFEDVDNLWAIRGNNRPLFVFAGHTDVVPVGPPERWESPPFTPTIKNGFLYGRGSADMKSSLAAMIIATERFIHRYPNQDGSIAFLITSDEEAAAINGTVKVMQYLENKNIQIDKCIVGEPSSNKIVGDTIKVGRRGSLNCLLTVTGNLGHVAYPDLTKNPIHESLRILSGLCERIWDEGNDYFPPTGFQISNIAAGTGATNVIPDNLKIAFNFRFNTEQTEEGLIQKTESQFENLDPSLNVKFDWNLSGQPFLTTAGALTDLVGHAIKKNIGIDTTLSTSGGTSDGRFIAPSGTELVELGPVNSSIHKINEHVRIDDIKKLTDIYFDILVGTVIKT